MILYNRDRYIFYHRQKADFDAAVKHCEAGRFNKAKPILEKLIKKKSHRLRVSPNIGQIYSDEGKQEEAINCLIDALRWDPRNTHALTMMGNIFARAKNDIQLQCPITNVLLKLGLKTTLP